MDPTGTASCDAGAPPSSSCSLTDLLKEAAVQDGEAVAQSVRVTGRQTTSLPLTRPRRALHQRLAGRGCFEKSSADSANAGQQIWSESSTLLTSAPAVVSTPAVGPSSVAAYEAIRAPSTSATTEGRFADNGMLGKAPSYQFCSSAKKDAKTRPHADSNGPEPDHRRAHLLYNSVAQVSQRCLRVKRSPLWSDTTAIKQASFSTPSRCTPRAPVVHLPAGRWKARSHCDPTAK